MLSADFRRHCATLTPWLASAVVVVLILSVQGSGSSLKAFPSNFGMAVSAHPTSSLTEINLEHGTYVSPSLVYNGYKNTNNRDFPVLLTGSATHRFWSVSNPVMMLAPYLPATTQGHDTGVLLFESPGAQIMTIHAVGAYSLNGPGGGTAGDGFEAYFLLTPPHTGNWSTPYYATNPEGANGTLLDPQGDVMFPYSTQPYIVVQWDPVYSEPRAFNVYLVHPGGHGVVRPSDILSLGEIGIPSKAVPDPHQYLRFNASYSLKTNFLTAEVADARESGVDYRLWVNLSTYGFLRPASGDLGSSHFYFGLGGSGNYPTGWGLLYLSLSESSGVSQLPPPPPVAVASLSPPVAFSTRLRLG